MSRITSIAIGASIAAVLCAKGVTYAFPTPLGTAFTYQGQLKLSGNPVNATADFQFSLWDTVSGPSQIGATQGANNITLTNGLFTVPIDFGLSAFGADARWLEIAVRSPAGSGAFTTLTPRQPLTAAPFALQTRGIVVDSLNRVGIGDTTPAALFTVGNGDQFQIESSGDVTFLNDLASITFPSCDAVNQPMIQMFSGGGGSNADRMVIAHSAAFSNWGLQYQDVGDRFQFLSAGTSVLSIDLNDGDLSFADDQGSINFPASSGANAPMINMFPGAGTATRMVLAHSPTFNDWGLQYDDPADRFNFLGNGIPVMSIDLANHNVGIGTSTPDPAFRLDVVGDAAIAGTLVVTTTGGAPATVMTSTDDRVGTFRRLGSDGDVLIFNNDFVNVGSISVAGGTVSYNAFTGSHFAWTDQPVQQAMLVSLTGSNHRLHSSTDGEVIYGIAPTAVANDSHSLAHLGLREPSQPAGDDNPHLVMAVGNGEMLVVDSGQGDIQPGDYLISSHVAGCAMKDDPHKFPIGYIVARAAERIEWCNIPVAADDTKRTRLSVFFENFIRNSEADQLAREVADLKTQLAALEAAVARLNHTKEKD